ncbi:MAG: NAD(P)H-hydrate dehydratase [Thermoanaerobaculia bacterium]|nr:NAD(P)H-hydrate dehydratase [Thermoanaerobaculia bacterium]
MRVLTAQQMAAVDRRAIDEVGIPGMVLMENAALAVADALGDVFPEAENVLVLCGPGNNGGDGLAVSRHLDVRGYGVRTLLLVPARSLRGDARRQWEILENQGPVVEEAASEDDVGAILSACAAADVVVDALFGTGLSRPLSGRLATVAEGVTAARTPVLAVDIPSGLDGSRAEPPGPHVVADLTVTFAAPKVAHVLPPSAWASSRLAVADLGIARHLVEEAPGGLHLLTDAEVRSHLVPRAADSHKGNHGHAVVVGGSLGMSGAVVLAARAAVRAGAGLVTAVVPPAVLASVDAGSVESMTLPYFLAGDETALAQLCHFVSERNAMALGPGAGADPEIRSMMRDVARDVDIPLVLDADGLNAFVGHLEMVRGRAAPTVLTPHPGEAGRLLGMSAAEVQADRLGAVRNLARETSAVVVLKGHRSLVAQPISDSDEAEVWINPTGNAGMATGGSGDVLAGILTALLARKLDAAAAARVAVYVHGLAGDLAAEEHGETALTAGDLVRSLAPAWSALSEEPSVR